MPYLGFLAGNLHTHGTQDEGEPYQGTYLIATDDQDRIIGTAAHYNLGSTVIYADNTAAARELADHIVRATGPPKYVLGEEACARTLLDRLAADGATPENIDEYVAAELTAQTFTPTETSSVRPARREETPILAAMRAAYHHEHFGRQPDLAGEIADLEERFETVLPYVAETQGRIAGCCIALAVTPRAAFIGGMYVDPRMRGQGVGKSLMSGICARLLPGRQRIVLIVRQSNEPARRCYRSVGFADVGPYLIVRMRD